MPWVLNNTYYIETDIRKMDANFSYYYIDKVVKKLQEVHEPDMPPIQPPIEEVLPLLQEWNKVYWVKTLFGKGGAAGKRKVELLKILPPIIQQWGEYMAYLITIKKVEPYCSGFPWLSMDSLRRPTSVSSYSVDRDRQKGTTTMYCSKKPALLLFFHWQASEDNQNWFTIATTSVPKLTTKKLDPDKRYFFRMYMTNPKGKSDMHFGWRREAF